MSAEEADAYFATRPRAAQLGAWASQQSRPLREPLRAREERSPSRPAIRHRQGAAPAALVGLSRRSPEIEFWHRPFRLHERVVFRRDKAGDNWLKTRLYP